MSKAILKCSKGFTLVEIIVTIVIAAIAASMMVTFMGKNITSSSVPVTWVKNQSEVNQAMENIVVEYKARIKAGTLAGKLGTSPDGFQTWINNKANYAPNLDNVSTTMVSFATGTEEACTSYAAAGSCTLKVTLTKGDMSVTGLFTD